MEWTLVHAISNPCGLKAPLQILPSDWNSRRLCGRILHIVLGFARLAVLVLPGA